VSARARSALALILPALVACGDARPGLEPSSPAPPGPSPHSLPGLRAAADLIAGTLTFEPLPPASQARGSQNGVIRAGIYGNQAVTVRIYNAPVTITSPSTPGKKTFSAPVGVRNLLAFPIGDEQAGPTPTDTMGIHVFVSSGPTVTGTSSSCSPACSVTVLNEHGTLAFSAANQPYWHWNERLGAAGGGNDTTRVRRTWTFEADTQVTAFQFEVLLSAAWANPNETRWKMTYEGDSIPDLNAEPRWTRNAQGAAGTFTLNSPSPGIIRINAAAGARVAFLQHDSLSSGTSAWIEARFQTNINTTQPEISFGIDDDVRFIGVGANGAQVGFLTATFVFLGAPVTVNTSVLHTYQIRKFGADSAQLWMDGTRIASRLYTAFSTSITQLPYFFHFGGVGTGFPPASTAGNSSSWDHVMYEIGSPQP
jgi:hypothetical protein